VSGDRGVHRRSLTDLAIAAGIEPSFWDVRGEQHTASADTLMAVLRAGGAPIDRLSEVDGAWSWFHELAADSVLEPVHTIWGSGPLSVRLRLPHPPPHRATATLVSELGATIDLGAVELDGSRPSDHGGILRHEKRFELAGEWPLGYHTLVIEIGDDAYESTLIVAPPTVRGFADDDRTWGVFAPLYALREQADLRSLEAMSAWLETLGGHVLATLPLLATYLDRPYAPSPYTPVSRRFWNESYCDVGALNIHADEPADASDLAAARRSLDRPGAFDYRAQAQLVRGVLAGLAWSAAEVEAAADELGDLMRYAEFRAVVERTGTGWGAWPDRLRSGVIEPGDYDPDHALAHATGQVVMRRQLLDLATSMGRRGPRLYLDLPIGAHPEGFDTWFEPELFAGGVATGAPPDDFFGDGQNWGFPPPLPRAGREQGHAHLRQCLRHHMEVAGILRLDHVMGLHRLYWVPDGEAATEGAYVRYPREEQFAVLALESFRNDCIVVGEDLGTVPDEIREAMGRHQAAGMYVAEFEMPSWPGAELAVPPHRSVASVDTHDTPTFHGFVHGLDIAHRIESELLDVADAHHEFEGREQLVTNLRGFLQARGLVSPPGDDHQLLIAALRFLGLSDAGCVLVSLEDLWGEVNPQNIPGTPADRPNWVQRFPFSVDRLATEPRVTGALTALAQSRRG
jgi:4-alpha-glucanotransferase